MTDPRAAAASATSVALVGIGGYGRIYTSALLSDAAPNGAVHLCAAVDPFPHASERLEELRGRQVPIYPALDELFIHHRPDLVVISSPFHLHAEQAIVALNRGSHVLCEKPMCVTVEQATQMLHARDQADRHVAIGYQWSFSPAIQRLKSDVAGGMFGAPRRLRTLVCWPRDERYYARNRWAGRQRDDQGRPVYDSPAANACAHHLHNMLYLLGHAPDRSAAPARVVAELYRAHPIENYDTAAVRCHTDQDVEVFFVASHATRALRGPTFHYEFEKAVVVFDERSGGEIEAHLADGTVRRYGSPWEASDAGKLWATLRAIRAQAPTVCGIEAAVAHTQVVNAAQASMPAPQPFPEALVAIEGEPAMRTTSVAGLDEALWCCYERGRLPSELGFAWARSGETVDVAACPLTAARAARGHDTAAPRIAACVHPV